MTMPQCRARKLCIKKNLRIAAAAWPAFIALPVCAADVWDNSSGDGNWFTLTNWGDDTLPTSADAVTFPAGFPGDDATIALGGGAATAQTLAFQDSYTLAGGTISVTNGVVNVAADKTATIASALTIVTNNGLQKSGDGTLILNTASTQFDLGLSLAAGTVRIEHAQALGTRGSGGFASVAGTLELADVSIDRDVQLSGGDGKLAATGTAALTGRLRVQLGQRNPIGVADGAKLTIGNADNDLTSWGAGPTPATIAVVATGGGTGGGTGAPGIVTLNNASDVVAHWSLEGGVLDISADDELGAAANNVTLAGGQLRTTLHDFSTARTITPAGGSISVMAKNFTLTTGLGAGDGALTTGGGGRLILQAASTRTGATEVAGGTLRLEHAAALGTGPVTLTGPGRIEVANVTVDQPLTANIRANLTGVGNAAWVGPITISETGSLFLRGDGTGNTLTVGDAPNELIGSADDFITISSGQFPGGTVVFPHPNAFPGGWRIFSQTLRIGHAQSLGIGTNPVEVGFGGVLELANGITLSRDVTVSGGNGGLRANGGAALARGIITVGAGGTFGTTVRFGTTLASDLLTLGDAPNDLTGGSANTIVAIDGPGTVLLAQPSDVQTQMWDVQAGTLRVDVTGALGGPTTRLDVGGRALLNAPQTIGLGQIRGGGVIQLAPSGAGAGGAGASGAGAGAGGVNTLTVNNIAFNALTSKLDIGDNAIVFRAGPANVIGTWSASGYAGGPGYTGVSGLIQYGRNGGTWDRDGGIVTSLPDAAAGLTAVGVAPASGALGISGGETATWRGQTVGSGDALVAYTFAGDATLDGKINIDDYGRIDSNIANSGSVFGWFNGDFNYDGKINIDDYGIIDSNISAAAAAPAPALAQPVAGVVAGVAAVPEPGAAGAVIIAAAMTLRRRRRAVAKGSARGAS